MQSALHINIIKEDSNGVNELPLNLSLKFYIYFNVNQMCIIAHLFSLFYGKIYGDQNFIGVFCICIIIILFSVRAFMVAVFFGCYDIFYIYSVIH